MKRFICTTCGTQHAASHSAPARCAICEDERQYVAWEGQHWTSHDELARRHTMRIEEEAGLVAIGLTPAFAIDQRSYLLPTDAGNILWESQSLVTDEMVSKIKELGGIDKIVISHPHFYGAMAEWSEAFDGVPIIIHDADQEWIQCPHPAIDTWSGDTLALSETVTLIRCGGHFQGSTALHWSRGPRAGGALFSGDALQVVIDRRHVSFMYSYPNLVPMKTSDVVALRERLAPYAFEDVLGYTWGRNIIGGGREAVDASFDRYLAAVRG
ncbi:MAG: MBL fold metallo-hydrolase [Planctomycetes bacterium]|nr:MBL fold metallo-hydrolase [Planctomycetota bacterium]